MEPLNEYLWIRFAPIIPHQEVPSCHTSPTPVGCSKGWEPDFPFQFLGPLKWLLHASEWCQPQLNSETHNNISPLLLWQIFKISQLWEICFGFLSSLKMNQNAPLSNLKSRLHFSLTYIFPSSIVFRDTPDPEVLIWNPCPCGTHFSETSCKKLQRRQVFRNEMW